MGDRGNIVLTGKETFGTARVYLYTHWGGSEMKETLAKSLERGKGRWNDGAYLARIIFSDFVGADHNTADGYGLSCVPGDNEWPFLVVDVDENQVWEEPDSRESFSIALEDGSIPKQKPLPFADFIAKHK